MLNLRKNFAGLIATLWLSAASSAALAEPAAVLPVPADPAARLKLPAGFTVNVYADLKQQGEYFSGPRFMAFDTEGQLYGNKRPPGLNQKNLGNIVRDAYQGSRYQFVGADLAARADAAGLVPKGDLIWHQAGTRLRPYGYPRVFVPNIAHQHILVLRREPASPKGSGQARRRLAR